MCSVNENFAHAYKMCFIIDCKWLIYCQLAFKTFKVAYIISIFYIVRVIENFLICWSFRLLFEYTFNQKLLFIREVWSFSYNKWYHHIVCLFEISISVMIVKQLSLLLQELVLYWHSIQYTYYSTSIEFDDRKAQILWINILKVNENHLSLFLQCFH